MSRRLHPLAASALLAVVPGQAFAEDGRDSTLRPGAGVELFASSDADKTDIVRLSARALLDYREADQYRGIVLERAWFTPFGQETRKQERAYLDLADASGSWRWKARIGSDGHTVLGSASLRRDDWSREFFVEREIIETPMGLDRGIYYTFAGASFDLPANERNVFTAMAGVQEFSGRNVRLHLRGSYIHVVKPEWGVSAQLRARYYHSTEPGEFDYYSPRDYLQLLPMLQLRRFDGGWEYRAQAAYGGQRATGAGWFDSRYANLRVTSPRWDRGWELQAEATYSNTSATSGPDYDYVMGRLGIAWAF
ncbi:MAG: hypothetical protein R3E09_12980 [Novosphingobium sp.]|nr:hypothetical protein [Novosphingobium sp.]